MPFSGTGVFNRLYSWASDAAASLKISSSRMDAEFNGIATGLTNCMTRDGQSPATANIPMGGFKLTGLANASASTDALPYGQADGRYGQLATTNTWALAQTFTTQPKAPSYGFTVGGSTAYIDADANNVAIKPAVGGKVYIIDTGGTRRTIECANAGTSVEAVTLGQADGRYAALAGLSTQTFDVANASAGNHAVNRTTGDARYQAKADIVFGTLTTASLPVGQYEGGVITHNLGTDDVDFGGTIQGNGANFTLRQIPAANLTGTDARTVHVGNNTTGGGNASAAPASGTIAYSIENAGQAQTVTLRYWIRKRS